MQIMRIAVHDYAGHPFQFDLSRELARRGHHVSHFYFAGHSGPKGQVKRLPGDPDTLQIVPLDIGGAYHNANFLLRARDDLRYGKVLARAIRRFEPDVVISGNTPLDSQRALMRTAQLKNARFVFWMQDYYSRGVRALIGGKWFVLGSAIASRYERLERAQLAASDAVVLISQDFHDPVKSLGIGAGKLHVIPNWGSIESVPVRQKSNAWAAAHGLAEKFVFLYSGTLGLKHNPHLLLELADRFTGDLEVVIVVAARGLGRDRLEVSLANQPRSNLRLLDLQPIEDLPDMLGASDVVVALLEAEAGEFSVPSKVLTYYCAQRPLLLSAPLANASARNVTAIGSGMVVAPGDTAGFLSAAAQLRKSQHLRAISGSAGRTYAEENFRIGSVADRFEGVLSGCLSAAPSPRHGRRKPIPRWLKLSQGKNA